MQKNILSIPNAPGLLQWASVVGKREHEGPLGDLFDFHDNEDKFGMDTWEQSEAAMQHTALNLALAKAKLDPTNLDALFAGDLINQCISSSYGLLDFDIPQIGLYGACSTIAEGLALAALTVGAGYFKRAAAITSSHYCAAERQFRFPLEYGGQRPPTAQWTVTGSAAFLVGESKTGPYLSDVLFGRTIDLGITDANNMGAAMAPAAVDTLTRYFKASHTLPCQYDLIVTGDLGAEGHSIVMDQMKVRGYDLSDVYTDCGLLIYHQGQQDVHAGGSGCGCSAVVLAAHLLKKFREGKLNNILFIGTGALMSPLSVKQGNSIPGIAHLIHLTAERIPQKET